MIVISCDPGKKGAFALLRNHDLLGVYPMPLLPNGWIDTGSITAWLTVTLHYAGEEAVDVAVIERIRKVRSSSGRTITPFSLIHQCGAIINLFHLLGAEVREVTPAQWQIYAYGRTNRGNKKLAAAWAQRKGYDMDKLYINGNISYDACEALIMGRFVQAVLVKKET